MINELKQIAARSPQLGPMVKILERLLERVESLESRFDQLDSDIAARARVLVGRVESLEDRLDDVQLKPGE